MSSQNFWFEDVIDAYLAASAHGEDWQRACAAVQASASGKPRRVLTQQGLNDKGIPYTRQHIKRKVDDGSFPPPFKLADMET